MIFIKPGSFTFFIFAILLLFGFSNFSFADQTDSELILSPSIVKAEMPSEKKWYAGTFCDLGDVVLGSRIGSWTEFTAWLGYKQNNINIYGAFSQFARFTDNANTGSLGLYLNYEGYYLHQELGFGLGADFIYKFQNITELSHKLYQNLFWQLAFTYRKYSANSTYIVAPGLTYYLGDNYIKLDYGISSIDGRGLGNFGSLKGSFFLSDRLRWDMGASVGQWLFDIYGFSATKENGYILYTMINYEIIKNMHLSVGYSYGEEMPSFIKRGFNAFLTVDF